MPGMLRSAPRRGRPEARREAGSASGSRALQSVRGLVELVRAAPAGGRSSRRDGSSFCKGL